MISHLSPALRPTLADLEIDLTTRTIDEPPLYACTAELWQEAGTFVTDDALVWRDGLAPHSSGLGVLTRHARPLSWLFFALRESCSEARRTGSHEEFFGRLADAANAHLGAHQPEPDDWRPLLVAVIREAQRIERERRAAPRPVRTATASVARHRARHGLFDPFASLATADC